ncbi:MAG: hypothetical protein AAGF24_03290 [Cyanobacteria bacterium P01_H01_bin.121]
MEPTASSNAVETLEQLKQLVDQIFRSRTITQAEQQRLMAIVMADGRVEPEEQTLINRVWDGLRQGYLKAVD